MSAPVPPTDVVCALIERGGLILLAQRPEGKRLAGLWEFPGGKVERDERPIDALHRELAEELGCRVTIIQSGPPVTHTYDWGSIRLHPFLCQLPLGNAEPIPHEHTAVIWVSPGDLLSYPLAPADVPIVAWFHGLATV
jgi:mutator protein MutT